MTNPVMSKIEQDFARTPNGYPQMPGYQVGQGSNGGQTGGYQVAAESPIAAQSTGYQAPVGYETAPAQTYQAPEAAVEAMTVNDVINRAGLCFLLMVAAAAFTWQVAKINPGMAGVLSLVGVLAALVMVLVASFKSRPSAILTMGYAVFEGLALGAISQFTELAYPGIVIQALLGTIAVFATCLLLFRSGTVRVTNRFKKIVMVSLISILGYSLLNIVLVATGMISSGSLDTVRIAGLPLGLVVGLIAVVIGAMSLIWDFDIVHKGVRYGAPREMAWSCALGIMVTVVWIYIELLRILELLRSR